MRTVSAGPLPRGGLVPSNGELLDLWNQALDPQQIGLTEAVAADLASFTGEPLTEVLRKMAGGKDAFRELWEQAGVNPANPEAVAGFYRDQFVEAYELADWHCGRTNGEPPLNYARAAWLARHRGLHRALDFGSGIGSGVLCLAAAGCEVHAADVALRLLEFVGHRAHRHGCSLRRIDLQRQTPPRNYFDLVTCFDVLEHIPDQLTKLRELESYLRPGGYLLVNLMKDSRDPDRPMHISSAGNWLAVIRKTSLCPDWLSFDPGMQVFVRQPGGRIRNCLAAWKDWVQGWQSAE